MKLYLFNIICIKTIDMSKYIFPKKEKIDEENRKIFHRIIQKRDGIETIIEVFRTIKIKQLDANIGINTTDEIINAYLIALLSSLTSIAIANTDTSFENEKIAYSINVSSSLLDLKIKSIIVVPLVKNISRLFKLIILFMKGGIKNGRKTSNRISNDYINDIN